MGQDHATRFPLWFMVGVLAADRAVGPFALLVLLPVALDAGGRRPAVTPEPVTAPS